jgi:hypothetical protein
MAPLIRFTLLALYLALVFPLPFLAPPDLQAALAVAVASGVLIVLAITSERVELNGEGIRVGHPQWCSWLLRRGWFLPWDRISGITPVATSQGGRVFYLRSSNTRAEPGERGEAFLLPQRVASFEDFLARFSALSDIDIAAVQRISPPWTYRLLAGLSLLLLLGETAGLLFINGDP